MNEKRVEMAKRKRNIIGGIEAQHASEK